MKPLALTMGDPAGIGGELTLRAWLAMRNSDHRFVTLDDPDRLAATAHTLSLNVPIAVVASPDSAGAAFAASLPVLPITLPAPARPGHPDKANARAVIGSIEHAAALALHGVASGM